MMTLLAALALAADTATPQAASPTPPSSPKATVVAPPVPVLTLPQQTAMDCAVAFGLISSDQANKRPGAESYPVMGPRHREYFVQLSAQLIDAYKIGRMQITELALASARRQMADPVKMRASVPGCVALLDASGV